MGKKSRSRDNTPISKQRLHAETPFRSFPDSLSNIAMSNMDLRSLRSMIYPTIPVAQTGYNDIVEYNTPRRARVYSRRSSPSAHHFNPYTQRYTAPVSSSRPSFRRPLQSLICIRRNIRKQIMFALNRRKVGAGAKKHKPRFNQFSQVRC